MPESYPVWAYGKNQFAGPSQTNNRKVIMNIETLHSKTGGTNSWRRRGFTLVELLLVLTILTILAGIVIPSLINRSEDARRTAARADIAAFDTALSIFEVDNGYCPKGRDALQCLITSPRDAQKTWKGPYIKKNKVPLDPWQRPYVFENPGRHNPNGYDLYTLGKDGLGGTNTIGNWDPD
jgi:general secretion pathway protein G